MALPCLKYLPVHSMPAIFPRASRAYLTERIPFIAQVSGLVAEAITRSLCYEEWAFQHHCAVCDIPAAIGLDGVP